MEKLIKEAFIAGYEQGHNDTVESGYGCSPDKADEYYLDISNQVQAVVKPDFCDNTLRLNTTELDILIDVFEGATKNIDQYRVLNRLLKHKLKIIESISKNSV